MTSGKFVSGFLFCLLAASSSFGQLDWSVFPLQRNWHVLFGNHRLTDKWGLHTEAQIRFLNISGSNHFWFARFGVDYRPTDRLMLTAGYGVFDFIGQDFSFSGEHRTWQQAFLTDRMGRVIIRHRIRLEQRWVNTPVYTFSGEPFFPDLTIERIYTHRLRYMPMVIVPLNKKVMERGTWSLTLQNEGFFSFGWEAPREVFTQNRAAGFAGYNLSTATLLQLGYLNQWLYARGNTVVNHIGLVQVIHNVDFRKKGERPVTP